MTLDRPVRSWLVVLSALLAGSGILLLWLTLQLERGLGRGGAFGDTRVMRESVEAVAISVLGHPHLASGEIREALAAYQERFERGLATYDRTSATGDLRALAVKLEHSFQSYLELAETLMTRSDEQAALSALVLERSSRLHQLIPAPAAGAAGDRSASARSELSRQMADAVTQWAVYRDTLDPAARDRALEQARGAERTLARLEESERLALEAEIDAWILDLQKSQVLAGERQEQLERFASLRKGLLSDLDRALDETAGSPAWAAWGSAALVLLLATVSAVMAARTRPVRRPDSIGEAALPGPDDDQRDRFISTLAHELRNPLGPILTAVQILEAAPPTDPRSAELRGVIGRQVRQLERLIDDLMDVSRIRRGQIELKLERMDLVELIRETAADYEGLLEEGKIELELSLPEEPVWILADRTRIGQVIGNLLQNAAKFTNPGGRVHLELKPDMRYALFELRDTGIGMGQSTLDAVFEPFRQGKRVADRANDGLGLGLALVKQLVDLHGGEVRAASKGRGEGSEFSVRLPLAE